MAQSYLPAEIAALNPDTVSEGYWESCARGQLSIQQCVQCKTFRHLPTPTCPKCRSFEFQYTPVSGRGTIFSYTIAHHPVHDALKDRGPYNVILVNLDDAPVRLVSNLVGVPNEQVKIGMPVEVVFEEQAPGVVIPRFRPRAD
jgi:uncharacterized OB-fold protein